MASGKRRRTNKMKTATVIATNNSLVQVPDTALVRMVTTSWDDGDPFDLRVAKLLAARRIPGTFYIPLKGHVEPGHRACRMSLPEMLELDSQGFEIGAHGVSHP